MGSTTTPISVEVISDHNNLKYFVNQPALNSRQARWATELAPYDFNIVYRAGKLNPADGPSRRPDYDTKDEPDRSMLSALQGKMSSIDPENMIVANIAFLPTLANKLASPFMATIRRRSGRDPLEEYVIATCRLGAAEDHNGSLIGTRKPTVVKMDPSGRGYLGGSLGLQYMVPRALAVQAIHQEDPFNPDPEEPLVDHLLRL